MSLVDRLAEFFKQRPGVWIDGRELAKVAGAYAWRSRVSDCRRKLSMTIENRERWIREKQQTPFGVIAGDYIKSEYRYLPDVGGKTDG